MAILDREHFTTVLVRIYPQARELASLGCNLGYWLTELAGEDSFEIEPYDSDQIERLQAGKMPLPLGEEVLRSCMARLDYGPIEDADVRRFCEHVAAMGKEEARAQIGAEQFVAFRVKDALHRIPELRDSLNQTIGTIAIAKIEFTITTWADAEYLRENCLTWKATPEEVPV